MAQIKISGVIQNIAASDTENIVFDIKTEKVTMPCLIKGMKSSVFYNYLIEGDCVMISGELIMHNNVACVEVMGLEKVN